MAKPNRESTSSFLAVLIVGTALLLAMSMAWAHPPISLTRDSAPLEIVPGQHYRVLAPHVRYALDPSHQVSAQDIIAGTSRLSFARLAASRIDFGFSSDRIWLQIAVRNIAGESGEWRLDFNARFMDWLEAYWVTGDNAQLLIRDGADMPFTARALPYRHLMARFVLEPNEAGYLLIGYRSSGSTALPLALETMTSFLNDGTSEVAKMTVVYTVIVMMVVYSLVFHSLVRSPAFLAAAIYAAVSGIYVLHMDGLAYQYIWPTMPRWNVYAALPLGYALTIAAAVFSRAFLNTREEYPTVDKVLRGLIWLTVAIVLSSAVIDVQFLKRFAFIYTFASTLIFMAAAWVGQRHGHPGARFFLLGWAGVALGALLTVAANWTTGPLPASASVDIVRGAILIEITMFALAMVDQFVAVRRDRDRSMRNELAALQDKLAVSEQLYQMEKKHAYARALAQARGHQLATASHDLRQPLLSLRTGLTDMVRRQGEPGESGERLRQSLDYLEGLVKRYLDMADTLADEDEEAAWKSAPLAPAGEDFPISILQENVHHMFYADARRKGIDLRWVESSALVEADPVALMRIISNFLSNAVNYASMGRILLGCRRQGDWLRIEVHDQGPGIAASRLEQLMQAGVRGAAHGAPGKGLGLAIAGDLARKHGYRLVIRSVVGKGSCFAVAVPRARHDRMSGRATGTFDSMI
ncbi:MAG: sensor histidine kinase [Pseudomonadota bacterium]